MRLRSTRPPSGPNARSRFAATWLALSSTASGDGARRIQNSGDSMSSLNAGTPAGDTESADGAAQAVRLAAPITASESARVRHERAGARRIVAHGWVEDG